MKKTILLVEDEAIIAMNEASILRKHDFEVITAYNAEKAIEQVACTSVDLVLMDIDLGENRMDGTKAAKRILECRELPIVFLTNHYEKEYVERVEAITGYGYVLKSAGEFVLVESINMAFKLFEAHAALKRENERHKQTATTLESERSLLRNLIDSMPDYIFVKDAESRFITTNSAHLRALGAETLEDVVGKTDFDFFPKELAASYYADEQNIVRTGEPLMNREEEVIDHKGGTRWVSTIKVPFTHDTGKAGGIIGISRDITEHKDAEKQLRLYKKAIDSSEDIIGAVDTAHRYIFVNDTLLRRHRLTREDVVGKPVESILGKEVYTNTIKPHLDRCLQGEIVKFETTIDYPNGGRRRIHMSYFPLREDGAIIGVVNAAKDITDTLDRYETFKKMLNSLNASIYLADMQTYELLFMNTYARQLFGDCEGRLCYETMQDGQTGPCPFCTNKYLLDENGRPTDGYFWESKNSVTGRWYKIFNIAIHWYNNRLVRLGIATDISDLKQKEETLKSLNEEKDVLMKELNHRVKNNLLMIRSLVSLKNAALGDIVDLSDLEHQIDAIQIVHEQLFQSESFTRIDLGQYIQDLLDTIFSSFPAHSIILDNRISEISLPAKTVTSLGIIVNEIATNAVKYGFRPGSEQRFTVDMAIDRNIDRYVFIVSNTGNPFPEEIRLDNPDTLGLRLIMELVSQMSGTITLERKPHPVFTFTFPITP